MRKLLTSLLLSLCLTSQVFAQVLLPATTSLQPGTPNFASTPTLSPGSGSYTSAQTVTITATTPGSVIHYTLDGTAPNSGSAVYTVPLTVSTSLQIQAIAIASGFLNSHIGAATYTINAVLPLYPQIGIQAIGGGQTFTTSFITAAAQFSVVVIGGNFDNWPAAQAAVGGGAPTNRDGVVQSLKSQVHSGKNAVIPLVGQYENVSEMCIPGCTAGANPWWGDWEAKVASNNWFLYNSHQSGTKTPSSFNANWVLVNPSHLLSKDPSTHLWPMQQMASMLYGRYFLGTGSAGTNMASTHLDFYYVDNQAPYLLPGGNGTSGGPDWLINGGSPVQTDATATANISTGKADYCAELATLSSSILCTANTAFAYGFSATGIGGLGMTQSGFPAVGIYALGMNQWLYGTTASGGASAVLNFAGFTNFQSWYRTLENSLSSGGIPMLTGGFSTTEYQPVRYALTATLMRNGVFFSGVFTGSNGYGSDIISPPTVSTIPQFDYFWGGTKSLAGYMGTTVTGTRGIEQSASWAQGVWERNYQNCAAFSNPVGNGSQTVTVTGLGYTNLYPLHSTQDPTHDPGGGPVTSITIAAGDGTILCNTVSP